MSRRPKCLRRHWNRSRQLNNGKPDRSLGRAAIRDLVPSVYLPTLVAELGVGAVLAVLALSPVRMGASGAVASAVVVAYGLGRIIGSAAAGALSSRRGSAVAMMLGLGAAGAASVALAVSTSVLPFAVAAMVFGAGHAVFHLGRQAVVVSTVPVGTRARALTTLAGLFRISNFVGPVVGALAIHAWGLRAAYVFAAGTIAAGMLVLALAPAWKRRAGHEAPTNSSALRVAREHRGVLGTLGLAVALTGAVRSARIVALPLWAEHIGLSDGAVSGVFALSAAVDMLLFFPAGWVMDRWGRRWTAVPSTALLALGILLLPLADGVGGVAILAIVLGIGNGWGSGLLMTLGADVAPARDRDVFLGLWMVLMDIGALLGPGVVALGALASLATGMVTVGAVGAASTVMLYRWVPGASLEGRRPRN